MPTLDAGDPTGTDPRRGVGTPSAIVLILAFASGIGPLATDMYLATFPSMATELRTTAASVQITLTAYMIGFGLGQYVIGAVSDRWGRRRLLIGGTALALVASAAAALAPSIALLWAARALQGIGAAAGVVLARAIIADLAHGLRLAQQLSLMMVIQGVAPIAAPLLGSILSSSIGWRGIMWIIAACVALLLGPIILRIPETLPRERRTTTPIAGVLARPLLALRSLPFAGLTLAITAAFGVLFAYISGSSFVLENVFGLDALHYGLVFAINAVVMSVMSALNARLVTRWSPTRIARIGLGLVGLGTLGATADAAFSPSLVMFVGCVTLTSMGLALALPNLTTLALDTLPAVAQGSGSAIIGTGQALSAAIVSPLVGLGGETSALPTAVVMLACASIAVLAAWGARQVSER